MKKIVCLIAVCACLSLLNLPISAKDGTDLVSDEEWSEFEDALPDRLRDEMIGEGGIEEYAESVTSKSGAEEILLKIFEIASIELGNIMELFLVLLALLIISAVFGTASTSFCDDSLKSVVRFCSCGAMFVVIAHAIYEHFGRIDEFFDSLGALMNAMIPMSASIWAMGGNISTASVGSASLFVMLSACEGILRNSVMPVCCVMSVLSMCDAISDEMKMGRMLVAVKKIYAFFLGTVMTVLLSSLSAQTAISASADTTASRTARMLSGNFIPMVGGSIGETLRTVGGSVAYLKNVFGIGGIIMIGYILLPVGCSVLFMRVAFLLGSGVAELLGCSNEARFLGNLGEVYGSMLAVISGVSVMFILALCVFMKTVIAVA